jgi:hypothetical protein
MGFLFLILLICEQRMANRQIGNYTDFRLLSSAKISVAEPHHFYAALAPAPGKNFDAAPAPAAPAPAPTLLYSKAKF